MNQVRPRVKYDVPPEWKKRIERGFCPVCNKAKEEFEPKMKIFCSPACREVLGEDNLVARPPRKDTEKTGPKVRTMRQNSRR